MKKWVRAIGIMLMIVLCTGCSENATQKTDLMNQSNKEAEVQTDGEKTTEEKQSNNETENQSEGEKTEMTAQQEEVFRSYGLADEKIEKMKKEGLSYKEQSFVDTAIMMLNYLEEKYSEKFKVVGGDIPGIFSHEYWITAKALEGEHAGEKFDVYYLGERGYKDGYITLLKQGEACDALKKLILGKFSDVLIFPSLSGEYGNELTIDNTGEEMFKIVSFSFDIVITNPNISEDEFMKLSENIEGFLNDNGVLASGSALYLNEQIEKNMTRDELSVLLDNDKVLKWSYFMSSH